MDDIQRRFSNHSAVPFSCFYPFFLRKASFFFVFFLPPDHHHHHHKKAADLVHCLYWTVRNKRRHVCLEVAAPAINCHLVFPFFRRPRPRDAVARDLICGGKAVEDTCYYSVSHTGFFFFFFVGQRSTFGRICFLQDLQALGAVVEIVSALYLLLFRHTYFFFPSS